jgi:serine/threonine-protein kinase
VTRKAIRGGLHRRDKSRPAAAPAQEHPFIGTVLAAKYRILRSIGSGGMGEVFEAEDLILRRPVAIKVVVNPDSQNALTRLIREAQLVSAMQHPNICAIYDVGSLPGGSPFLVLERLHGETLGARLRREQIEDTIILDVFRQVLSGMDAAHRSSIIHRDLKPDNVFLSERLGFPPHVKILDFGFAKDLSGKRTRTITQPGSAVGTPRYMAPEQLLGKGVDGRTDLFAVALMLFESLTGRHPFDAKNITLLHMNVLGGMTARLATFRPDLPTALQSFFDRALAKSMDARFRSASEMHEALLRSLPFINEETQADEEETTDTDRIPALAAKLGDSVPRQPVMTPVISPIPQLHEASPSSGTTSAHDTKTDHVSSPALDDSPD